jgi:hypothetical protein
MELILFREVAQLLKRISNHPESGAGSNSLQHGDMEATKFLDVRCWQKGYALPMRGVSRQ